MVIQCVYDQYYQTNYESINSSSKLEILKCMTKGFGSEKYLSCYLKIAIELLYLDLDVLLTS